MDIFYENQQGVVHFCGDSRRGKGIFLKKVTGLGLVEKEYKTMVYSNQPGQTLIAAREPARMITLSVDICSPGHLQEVYRQITGVLHQPGDIRIMSGTVHRKIACRCIGISEPERWGRNIMTAVLQFVCDKPYFTDSEQQLVTLFSRNDLIQESFVLPCVFTERTRGVSMVNYGSVPTEPVISIYNTGLVVETETQTDEYGILIQNHRTEQSLKLLCHTQPGELITVDIPGRKVTSNFAGNLVDRLSQDSFLSDFQLAIGENYLEIINLNPLEDISVTMRYDNQYIEAVM